MSTPRERREVYATKRWKALRAKVLLSAGHMCARCRREWRRSLAVLVHHVEPIRQGGDPWNESNLEPVCNACHEAAHAELEKAERPDPERDAWEGRLAALANIGNGGNT